MIVTGACASRPDSTKDALKRGVHHRKCIFQLHVKQLENIKSTLSAAKVNLGKTIARCTRAMAQLVVPLTVLSLFVLPLYKN